MKLQAQTHCTAFWRGRTRRFALALAEGFIHFWEPDSEEFRAAPDEWVWVVEGQILDTLRHRKEGFARINADFLEATFRGALDYRRVGRRVVFVGKPVYLGFHGQGSILLRGSCPGVFSFENYQELWTQNESFWWNRIQQWLAEDGDFAFAWTWMLLSENEQAAQLTELCAGDRDEMGRIADWVLALDGYHGATQPFPPENLIAYLMCFNGDYSVFVWDEEDEPHTHHLDLWNVWMRFFNPVFRYELAEKHISADLFSQQPFHWSRRLPMEIQSASQHEQLETRLELRDWLRERAGLPDERINELLA